MDDVYFTTLNSSDTGIHYSHICAQFEEANFRNVTKQ